MHSHVVRATAGCCNFLFRNIVLCGCVFVSQISKRTRAHTRARVDKNTHTRTRSHTNKRTCTQHDALVGRVEQHLVNALCAGSTAGNDNLQHMPNVVTEEMLTKIEQNQCVTA